MGAKNDQTAFDDQDEAVAISLAAIAGNAVELATTVRQHQRHLTLIDGPNDPDAMIRDLFSLRLDLHMLTSSTISADDRATLSSTIDQAIRRIRTVTFTPW